MKTALVALLALSLTASGCTTTRLVTPGPVLTGARTVIHEGDRAKILLKTGAERSLRIETVDDQTLTGREGSGAKAAVVQIAIADVQSIKVTRTSGLRTGGLVVGILIGTAVVGATAILMAQCGVKLNDCGD